jgi:hypothetical protein
MQTIRYRPGQLVKMAGFLALGAAFFAWVLLSPETFREMEGRRSGIAHLLADYPALDIGFLLFLGGLAARMLLLCTGDRLAIAITRTGLDIRTLGGRHRPAWSEIARVELVARPVANSVQQALIVHVRRALGTKKLSLSAAMLDADEDELAALAAELDREAALARQGAAGRTEAGAPTPEQPAGAHPRSVPAGFGRKGL